MEDYIKKFISAISRYPEFFKRAQDYLKLMGLELDYSLFHNTYVLKYYGRDIEEYDHIIQNSIVRKIENLKNLLERSGIDETTNQQEVAEQK